MKMILAIVAALAFCSTGEAGVAPRRKVPLLQLRRHRTQFLQRANGGPAGSPSLFAAPSLFGTPSLFGSHAGSPTFTLNGFCKRIDRKPACTAQPCCCWGTFGAEQHPAYPSPDEVDSSEVCLNPPDGFEYAPEPGLTSDDGYVQSLIAQNKPLYMNRRLCCLHRSDGMWENSQRDLRFAVPTMPPVTTTSSPDFFAAQQELINRWTTTTLTTQTLPLLNPGDEYENAQMEEAARAHLAAANDLMEAAAALNGSANAIEEVNEKLQTDPSLVRRKKRVTKIKTEIRKWAERRWVGLRRLSKDLAVSQSSQPSALEETPPPPLPSSTVWPHIVVPRDLGQPSGSNKDYRQNPLTRLRGGRPPPPSHWPRGPTTTAWEHLRLGRPPPFGSTTTTPAHEMPPASPVALTYL